MSSSVGNSQSPDRDDAARVDIGRDEIQSVLDAIPAIVWYKDTCNRVILANDAAAASLARPKNEIEGHSIEELYPDGAALFYEQDLSVIRSREPTLGIVDTITSADGHVRWYRTDKIPTFDADGNVVGLIVVSTDVTELKAREAEIEESEQRFRRAVTGSTDGLWEWVVGTETVYYSPRFSQLLGFAPEEWGDRLSRFREYLHPEDSDRVWSEVERHLERDTDYDIRYRLLRKDGSYCWFRARGNALRDDNGKPVLMSGTIQDIDDLVRAEEALQGVHRDLEQRFNERTRELRRSEAKFQDLYDHSPEMHITANPHTRMVVECNDTLADALGYAKDDIVGMRVFDLYHPDCREQTVAALEQFSRDGEIAETELMLACQDGSSLDVSLRVTSVRGERGDLQYVRLSCRDITQRKSAEQMLRRREDELAHVARLATMGEMAAGLAHELNQPLYSVANYARGCMLRLDADTMDPSQLQEILEEIASEAERAGEIIRRLRRMVQKNDPLETELDVNEVIKDACQLLTADLRRANVSLQIALDPSAPRANSDDVQLQQIIVNLARNAVEAMKESPIDTRICRVSSAVVDNEIRISIADSGCGLSEEDSERLFDAFHTTSDTGMGMGLAISRSIVELHGGRIWATANPDRGATFHFTIPLLTKA